MPVGQALVHSVIVFNAALNAAGDDHGARLTADLALGDDLLVEVADHHVGFLRDGERLILDEGAELFLCLLFVEHRVILHRFFFSR